VKFSWDRRIERAEELSRKHSVVSDLLNFYKQLARFQKGVHEQIAKTASHSPEILVSHFAGLLTLIRKIGNPTLIQACDTFPSDRSSQLELLLSVWQPDPEDEIVPTLEHAFFAQILLQPYAECMAERMNVVPQGTTSRCPFCGSMPQVAVLRQEGDGAKRSLICSLCATEWSYRRVVCPNCGEEQKDRLPIFMAQEFDYVRVDACDTCHTYIKSIDLTKDGRAVPMVDELATVSLNLWAQQNNYQKIAPNLFGV
jgi:FdhE protein